MAETLAAPYIRPILEVLRSRELRNKILFILFILLIYRVLSLVPVPVNFARELSDFLQNNQGQADILGFLDLVSGGALAQLSLAALGVGPYITASIIMQLMTKVVPPLTALSKEGEFGRKKIEQYTRVFSVPIAFVQGFGIIKLMLTIASQAGIESVRDYTFTKIPGEFMLVLLSLAAGTVILMWLGELITERGIGNGVSFIIFVGIVSNIPQVIGRVISTAQVSANSNALLFNLLIYGVITLLVILGVVFVTEGIRNIPIQYARAVRGVRTLQTVQTSLPLRVNMGGVVPIIFALALVQVPQTVGQLFSQARTGVVADAARWLTSVFAIAQPTYWIIYFVMVVALTFFTTFLYFHPKEVAENIQKQGGFIPGIRPGEQTAEHLTKIINRISLFGALFLGFVAVMPYIVQNFLVLPGGASLSQTLSIGGTGLLIVVSVVIEMVRQVNAQLLLRRYEL